MNLYFSFIIPVYNRPNEIEELLKSIAVQNYPGPFEVVIVEDGSTISSEDVVKQFSNSLSISYYTKKNTGPGDTRNYGMQRAKGNYFIILDSDCILPPHYLNTVYNTLKAQYVHCYGGPDAAHESFSVEQKAINYSMTSVLTTGGIRGNKRSMGRFQPRSFNMGISRTIFDKIGGFGNIHPGEDPDFTFRIWNSGFDSRKIPEAFVYHKRRINWQKFYVQVKKFGMVRPILNLWHPGTAKVTYWFPTFFCIAFLVSLILWGVGLYLPLFLFFIYFGLIFVDSLLKNRSLTVAFLSLVAVVVQFVGYGFGFLKSTILITFSKKKPQELFPELFF
ncbi:glycosyltransferase [Pareuzebyella sediminis]|uniref:glycosyltransferase n=1 Tax=Pareuzebyella sediminis TaxID=2607998 RepID=UPI0011EFA325|nr:glycosyltransferase [Pareuzebyella sediminis]